RSSALAARCIGSALARVLLSSAGVGEWHRSVSGGVPAPSTAPRPPLQVFARVGAGIACAPRLRALSPPRLCGTVSPVRMSLAHRGRFYTCTRPPHLEPYLS